MVDGFLFGGLAVLIASALAVWFNRRVVIAERPPLWRKAWTWRWHIGVLCLLASPFMRYRVGSESDRWTILGFPLPAAFFDKKGFDYVGPTSGPFMILNALFWLLLPQLFLWLTSGNRRRAALKLPVP